MRSSALSQLLRKDMDKLTPTRPNPTTAQRTGSSNNSSAARCERDARLCEPDKKQGIFDASASGMAESALSSTQSRTYRHVMNVRNEAVGVTYDSDGRVVVDKSAAQRVIRLRRWRSPSLSVQSTLCGCGVGHALRLLNVAINQGGVHLYTWNARHTVASISFIPNATARSSPGSLWNTIARTTLCKPTLHRPSPPPMPTRATQPGQPFFAHPSRVYAR